jgi:hypothetical protein
MSQIQKISKNNTVVLSNKDGSTSVILHTTEIVRHWPQDRKLRLDTGGWFTPTTRTRMTQCFRQWGLPVRVGFSIKDGNRVETFNPDNGETVESFGFSRDHLCYLTY